ncbi:glycosyltransferase family 10 [bacterium]|nr:glycosyltransferase family 10 [bacterium]
MFLCNWGESSESILRRYSKQTPGCTGIWKNLTGTSDENEADAFIVLEGLEEGMNVNFDRTLFVKREPDFIKIHDTRQFKHTLDWSNSNCGITWWLSKTYDQLSAMEYPDKTKLASCVASNKHKHRNSFIKSLFKKPLFSIKHEPPPIDLYGRGHNGKYYGQSYKGTIKGNGNCKLSGLESYTYSLVLENSQQPNYWTEKLADAYLAWCVPIYWGCPNIGDYFSQQSFHSISLKTSVDEIIRIINRPIDREMIDRIKTARESILNEFNIWEIIRNALEQKIL